MTIQMCSRSGWLLSPKNSSSRAYGAYYTVRAIGDVLIGKDRKLSNLLYLPELI